MMLISKRRYYCNCFITLLFVGVLIFVSAPIFNKLLWHIETIDSKQPIEDREAIFKRISYVLDFKTISPDYISTYTVNEVTGDGILKPKDDCERKIDLKKYFNPSSDMDRKERFLEEIEAL